MSTQDITLRSFLTAFFPNENEEIRLRLFKPKGAPSTSGNCVLTYRVAKALLTSSSELQEKLKQANQTRGVYFAVNAGGDEDKDIIRFNAWFAEDDTRSIEEQHQMLSAAPLPPSIRVETLKSVHAYWLVASNCGSNEWRDIQHRLINYFHSDTKIKNPSRVMRLPFFNHVHFDKESGALSFKRVEVTEFEPQRRYTLAEMQAAFAPVCEPVQETTVTKSAEGTVAFTTWDELNAETARRIRLSAKARTDREGWTHAPGLCHGSIEGTAQYVSPDGAYGCLNGCPTEQVRASHLLPERPEHIEAETNTIQRKTRGAPASRFTFTTLDDLLDEPEEEIAYVWDRTLPRGGFSICAAKPKVGKSTLARNLAVAISCGDDFFGRATMKGKVIYLCLEEKRAEVTRHFRQMKASGTDIIIFTGRVPSDELEALEAAIREHAPVLIIIDPLSRFVRVSDFNSYAEITRALEPLIDLARSSECQCHIMAVHHNGKGEREGGDALLGSTALFGAVDTLLTMKKQNLARTIQTVQRYGEDIAETVVHLDVETGLVTNGGDMQALVLKERKDAVLEIFGDEPLAEGDVKERIGGTHGLTAKAVRSLYEEGRLRRTGTGKKGDPYLYQKAGEDAQNSNENSRFSGFPIYTDLENPENLENLEASIFDEIYIPADMSDEDYERQFKAMEYARNPAHDAKAS